MNGNNLTPEEETEFLQNCNRLKTLKDLTKKQKEYHTMFPKHWKYSEDFNKGAFCAVKYIEKQLKAEAVKDYKKLLEVSEKGDTLFKEHGKIAKGFEVDIHDYEQDDVMGILKYIKWKFNLTEADLK